MNLTAKMVLGALIAMVLLLSPAGMAWDGGTGADGPEENAPESQAQEAAPGTGETRADENTRVVLIEEFTASWCGPCVNMRTAVEQIMDDYGKTKVALLEYHVWDSGNPQGSLSTSKNDARASAYGVSGIPDVWVDGIENIHGGGTVSDCYNRVKAKVDTRLAIDSILTVDSDAEYTASSITIDATIGATDTVSQSNLNIVFVVYEMGPQGYDYVVRDFVSEAMPNTGFPHVYQKVITVGGGWNYNNMDGVIFIQQGATGEVLQAANIGVNLAPNIPPAVVPGSLSSVSFDEDTPYTGLDLTGMFSDEDGDDLTYAVSGDTHLTVEDVTDGHPTITPEADWNGEETLTFTADDGRDSVDHDIIFTVAPVNDAPNVKKNLQDFKMLEDGTDEALQLSKHFDDIDGDDLTYSASGNEFITVDIDPATSMVVFTPDADWNGEQTITFTADDGAAVAFDNVKVVVEPQNDAPYLVQEFTGPVFTFDEDTVLYDLNMHDFFDDIDGDDLWFYVAGRANLDITIDEWGDVMVIPAENYTGEETVTFSATDTLETVEAEATFVIAPVNDDPWLAPIDDQIFDEDVEEELEIRAIDAEDEDLEFTVTTDPALPSGNILAVDDDFNIVYTATNADVGEYEVTIEVEDESGGEAEVEFDLEIENMNDDPVAVISLPLDGAIFTAGDDIEFDGGLSTDDDLIHGDQLTYRWQKGNKMLSEQEYFEDTIEKAGDYIIKLTVYDSAGRSSFATVDITVEPAEVIPDPSDGGDQPDDNPDDTPGAGSEDVDKASGDDEIMGMSAGIAYAVFALIAIIVVILLIGMMMLMKKPPAPEPQQPQAPAYQPDMYSPEPAMQTAPYDAAPAPAPASGAGGGALGGSPTTDPDLMLPPPMD